LQGVFVRTWCPELARLPNEYIQTPWLAPSHVLKEAGVELGVNYPRPIIIVPQWNQQVNVYMILMSIYISGFFSFKIVEHHYKINIIHNNVVSIFILKIMTNEINSHIDYLLAFIYLTICFCFILSYGCFEYLKEV